MTNELQLDITRRAREIQLVCEFGMLFKPSNLPPELIQSYNLIKIRLGDLVGWADKEKYKIDSKELLRCLHSTVDIYLTIRTNIIQFVFKTTDVTENDFDKAFSDAAVFRYGFANDYLQQEAGRISTLVATSIRLANFHTVLGTDLEQDYIDVSNTEELLPLYTRVIHAQSQLIAAQDLLIVSQEFNSNILNKSDIELHDRLYELEISQAEKRENSAEGGRKNAKFRGFESIILEALKKYETNRQYTRERVMNDLQHQTGKEISENTLKLWLKNYRATFGRTIFKRKI
tara:strand:- start:108 stop:971 length:864 start_codon:yes stop_codon:yes gene_type:complete